MTAGEDAGDCVRTALVTGGTGGMGRVIAAQLAADGFDVAVAYAGGVDLADATVKEIAGHGRRGAGFAADIADEEATSTVFDAVEDRLGHLDVVVHTAGINHPAALADLAEPGQVGSGEVEPVGEQRDRLAEEKMGLADGRPCRSVNVGASGFPGSP